MNNLDALDDNQQNILRGMGKRKAVLFVRAMTKLYNKLCSDCRAKVIKNQNTPLDQYCDKCRFKIQNTIDKYK